MDHMHAPGVRGGWVAAPNFKNESFLQTEAGQRGFCLTLHVPEHFRLPVLLWLK